MKQIYRTVQAKPHFPDLEQEILAYWKEHKVFEQSLQQRKDGEQFVFYDGPPFATGLPHFGHFVPGTIKDIFPRYFSMKGYYVERRFGWDCHGLPVEYEVEKQLGISGLRQIEEYGIDRFNEACRDIVLRYAKEWRETVIRMGRWVDFDNEYRTMDCDYMESIWWVFRRLWEQDLVYRGYNILPYSPNLASPLSNFEVNLGGYQDVHDPSLTVRFRMRSQKDTYFVVWTTTPWTLPSNLALAVSPDLDYVRIQQGDEYFILAAAALHRYYKDDYNIVGTFPGSSLQDEQYEPLFPYFSDLEKEGAFRVFCGNFVQAEDGSGIVHLAPGFGEDDFALLKDSGIPTICPIDAECRFTDEVPDYAGQFVKDADKAIMKRLQEEGKVVKREQILHSYPFCYRSGKPLIYRAVSSWFVRVSMLRDKLVELNKTIRWVPEHLQSGRFGNWLENAKDWAISRNRFWGNPIPVWSNEDGSDIEVIGSRAELEARVNAPITDLHKHVVDTLVWEGPNGTMRRVPEVLDCWFESGAMPYAQNHYPMENSKSFEANFPADFVSEGLDQTRGWFYTLMVHATALFEKPAFRNVVVSGLVLAEDGKKMSKSANNYSDPKEVINSYGSDALRLFLMHSVVVQAEDVKFSDNGVRDVLKSILIPLWNAYSFFVTYANIDGVVQDGRLPETLHNSLDRWIVSEIERLTHDMRKELDAFLIKPSIDHMVEYIDMMNNWYIRRSRRRFWKSDSDTDKQQAYAVLCYILLRLCQLVAPIIPFLSEYIYQDLRNEEMPKSVHLCDYPQADDSLRDKILEQKMDLVRNVVRMGHALRRVHAVKTRQPLTALHIVTPNREERTVLMEMEDVIREELNVKSIVFQHDESELVEYRTKPNYAVLGKQLGSSVQKLREKMDELSSEDVRALVEGNTLYLDIDGSTCEIHSDNVIIERREKEELKILNEGTITIALDTRINEELRQEGLVRDLVRKIQNMRKEEKLDVSDRIILSIEAGSEQQAAMADFLDYLKEETLATNIIWQEVAKPDTNIGEISIEKLYDSGSNTPTQ